MKTVRYALTGLLLLAPLAAAEAQIVIDALPFTIGSGPYVQYNTVNEDGSNTAVINALIGQAGANQTYDLTAIDFEDMYAGTYTITGGATGPGADIEPLDQATKTLILPFREVDGDDVYEGTIHDYVRETEDAAYNMGGFFEGTYNGSPVQFVTTIEPEGEPDFIFPMTFGSTWSAAFTETVTFGGSTFDTDYTKEYEVDGWGTMLVPNLEEPIEVLRVKSTETQMIGGFEFITICYDLRANGLVVACFCEGEFSKEPTANVTILNASATDAESDLATAGLMLEAAYPNPAWESTTLRYRLPEAGPVLLTVYDVLGRAVLSLVDEVQGAGLHDVAAETGKLMPGVYVARLEANGVQRTRSFTVVH